MIETGSDIRERALAAWEVVQREVAERVAREQEKEDQERLDGLQWALKNWLGLEVEVSAEPCLIDGIPFALRFRDRELCILLSCPDCGEYRWAERVYDWAGVGRVLAECIRFASVDEPQTVRQEPCSECVVRYEWERGVRAPAPAPDESDPLEYAQVELERAFANYLQQITAAVRGC